MSARERPTTLEVDHRSVIKGLVVDPSGEMVLAATCKGPCTCSTSWSGSSSSKNSRSLEGEIEGEIGGDGDKEHEPFIAQRRGVYGPLIGDSKEASPWRRYASEIELVLRGRKHDAEVYRFSFCHHGAALWL